MKFSQYKYERSSYEDIKDKFIKLVDKINKSTNYEDQKNYILQLNEIRNDIQSNSTIASIRYSIDTSDEYYEEEKKYWDEYMPLYEDLNCEFYKAIVNSQFKNEIINDFSKQFYNICEDSIKSFSKEIIEDLQEENKLCSQYTKLLASAKIEYKGRKEVEKIDSKALKEAVINAIVHNDYSYGNTPIIELYSDRIEITSAGGLPQELFKTTFIISI